MKSTTLEPSYKLLTNGALPFAIIGVYSIYINVQCYYSAVKGFLELWCNLA